MNTSRLHRVEWPRTISELSYELIILVALVLFFIVHVIIYVCSWNNKLHRLETWIINTFRSNGVCWPWTTSEFSYALVISAEFVFGCVFVVYVLIYVSIRNTKSNILETWNVNTTRLYGGCLHWATSELSFDLDTLAADVFSVLHAPIYVGNWNHKFNILETWIMNTTRMNGSCWHSTTSGLSYVLDILAALLFNS